MIRITINNQSFQLPASWKEISREQFLVIVRVYTNSKDVNSFLVSCLLALLQMRIDKRDPVRHPVNRTLNLFKFRSKTTGCFFLTPDQISELASKLDYLLEEHDDGNKSMVSYFDSNPFPSLKHKGVRYYGPADRLFNISFAEFIEAETHYMNFLKEPDFTTLDQLLATFYRKADPMQKQMDQNFNGDIRLPFNDHLVSYHARQFNSVAPYRKLSVFFFYQGCRNFLISNFPNVFASQGYSKKKSYGMASLVDALSMGDVTRNESIRKTMLYDVLIRFEHAAQQKLELKA
jgi:hypothetical protein